MLLLVACAPPPAADPTAEPEPEPSATEIIQLAAPTLAPTETAVPSPTLTVTPAPSLTPTLSSTPEPERVRVFGGGSPSVNMRREPGTNSAVVKSVRDGTEVTIVGLDRESDGRLWRNVQEGDAVGWIVSTALRALPTPTVTPSSTPTPAATSTTTPAPGVAGAATIAPGSAATSRTPTATPQPERVEIVDTGSQGANIRVEPNTSARVLQTVPNGTRLTIIGEDRQADGRTWRNVRGESGASGWVVSDVTRSLATATPTVTPSPAVTATRDGTATPAVTGTPPAGQTPAASRTPAPPAGEAEDGEPAAEEVPDAERVEVYDTGTQGANLRAQPGRGGSVLRSVPDGSVLTVIGEDRVVDGITWRNVQTADGTAGWLAVEVVRTLVTPTPTPRPGAPGVGAPIVDEALPEDELTEEQRIATPCRPGQLKGDATTGVYYLPDHPEYAGLRQRVRCFDDASRARASGFLPPEALPPPEASPSPLPR